MDPLTDFTRWNRDAPYLARGRDFDFRARVVAVKPKFPYVAARLGGIAHLHNGVAAVFRNNTARFGARFMCGAGSNDVAILPNVNAYGGVCMCCEDVAAGPCVYRCFNSLGVLLYIGSTVNRLKRLMSHRSQTTWWNEVADTTAEHFPTIFEARAAERLAILAEKPLYNRMPGNRRRREVAS